MDLAPYIRELLLNHECFILPGFGGFETSYSPAKYDQDNKQMLPPSKKVNFKPEYKIGGEVLEKHLCKKLSIEPVESKQFIKAYIEDLKTKLRNQEQVLIEGVGIFYPDYAGKPNFETFKEENYLVDSFGLDPLPIKKPGINNPIEESKIQIKEIAARNTTLTFVIVGVILVSMLMIATILLSSKFDVYLFNIGDKNNSVPEKIIIGGNQDNNGNVKVIEETIESQTSLKNALSIDTVNQVQAPKESNTKYYLVVGSYKNQKNANELQSKLTEDGFSAEIIKSKENFRVCIGNYDDKHTAQTELNRIRRQINHSVWLLSVKSNEPD